MSTDKIQPSHRERAAYIYIRQSTMSQVRYAKESQKRQYALAERARELGFREVTLIDDDLGKSGSGTVERPGFGRLLTAVCEGTVGAVIALEASRLARNNRDWHHLIDLCAMTSTLVIDEDGVYDPRSVNDRLLLGLKGSLAEFELGLLRQRGHEALLQMTRRGLVLKETPVGYIRTEDYRMEMIPDRQVQEAIRGVFTKFRELGSARQVFLWYCQERVPLPRAVRGSAGKQIDWRTAVYHHIIHILKNPAYAGTFAHGRSNAQMVVQEGRARRSTRRPLPIDEWKVVIHDHHAGYIAWDEFLRNQKLLRENLLMGRSSKGAARRGHALLGGMLRCAHCGCKFHVHYGGKRQRVARYVCRGAHINRGAALCLSFGGLRVDEAVSTEVLEALQPIGVEASLLATELAGRADDEKRKALELALQKARYETDRARRQFDAVDPENRLVAGELEMRWNDALRQVAELESRLDVILRQRQLVFSESERERLLELGEDLTELWHHPHAAVTLKKRILRTVLEEIIVDVREEDDPKIHLRLHWAGGSHTELLVPKNRIGKNRHCTEREVVDLVRELAKVCRDKDTASILNRLGYRTGSENTWKKSRVASLRETHDIPRCVRDSQRTWRTLNEAADELGVCPPVVRRLIEEKTLPATQVVRYAPWVIERKNLFLPAVQEVIRAVHEGRRRPRSASGQRQFPF